MKKALLVLLAVIGALVLIGAVMVAGIAMISVMGKSSVPGKIILEVDLEQGLVEYVPQDPFAKMFLANVSSVRDVVDSLERASEDDRVVALVARVGTSPMGVARIQEVRDAVESFAASGKPTVAWAETFGEAGAGNGAYYLATAFDEIYLQPSGDVGLTGLMVESPFLKGTLEKIGVEPRMDHRHEYKNAMNVFTEREYTRAHREATTKVMNSMFGQMVRGIAEARGMSEEEVRGLTDRGPFLGQEAQDANLVDELLYRDEVYARVREAAGGGADLLFLHKYLKKAGRPHSKGETIALIYGVGSVVRGASEYDPMSGQTTMGPDTVGAAIREAVANDKVKAIVFRVDSPGGSYVASDTIWRETVRAKEAGKPVIVTMGDVAGSGGYFVSMSADKIVAQPGTITASIGVLGGKFLTTRLWDKLGITWDEVHTSSNATMWTGTQDYTSSGWSRYQAFLDRVYEDFTGKVAEGRGLSIEHVREIAKGRIWTGEDAKEIGLVDELGGYATALRLAREAAGIEPDADVRVRVFPSPRSPFEALFEDKRESSEPWAAAMVRVVEAVRPYVRLARRVGLGPQPGVLSVPEVETAH